MSKTIRTLQGAERRTKQALQLVYGDVADDSPLTVLYDGDAETQPQSAFALDGLVLSIGDKVAVLKSAGTPGLVIGTRS